MRKKAKKLKRLRLIGQIDLIKNNEQEGHKKRVNLTLEKNTQTKRYPTEKLQEVRCKNIQRGFRTNFLVSVLP